jgi:hypothetical protein
MMPLLGAAGSVTCIVSSSKYSRSWTLRTRHDSSGLSATGSPNQP